MSSSLLGDGTGGGSWWSGARAGPGPWRGVSQ
ncbi:hypothetical protein SFR_0801 [Streptomyces sp. FR-008]|nr:hypothetical protein SFR_0801 [Streptomyces sp. FR-008]